MSNSGTDALCLQKELLSARSDISELKDVEQQLTQQLKETRERLMMEKQSSNAFKQEGAKLRGQLSNAQGELNSANFKLEQERVSKKRPSYFLHTPLYPSGTSHSLTPPPPPPPFPLLNCSYILACLWRSSVPPSGPVVCALLPAHLAPPCVSHAISHFLYRASNHLTRSISSLIASCLSFYPCFPPSLHVHPFAQLTSVPSRFIPPCLPPPSLPPYLQSLSPPPPPPRRPPVPGFQVVLFPLPVFLLAPSISSLYTMQPTLLCFTPV